MDLLRWILGSINDFCYSKNLQIIPKGYRQLELGYDYLGLQGRTIMYIIGSIILRVAQITG